MKKGLIALALGTFGLGMTEYVMMSILPDLADTLNIDISRAGHLISAYAVGVCVGAPSVAVFMRNMPLKRILLWLMAVYALGNLLFALSGSYAMGMAARFVTGLPHGAFFGVGSILASRLMPDRKTTAVAIMTLGMTVANLVGIPVGSFVAGQFSWDWIFVFDAILGLCTLWAIRRWVSADVTMPATSLKKEFAFLRHPAPWLLIGATTLCQGGAFALYSYVSPVMTQAGLAVSAMPLFMVVVGGGMCLGNYVSGVLSDRFTPSRVAMWVGILMTAMLAATMADGFSVWLTGATVTAIAALLFALSSPMQLLMIEYSPGGELMGGAMVQVSFNLGNAIGAFVGGVPIAAGYAASSSALTGIPFAALSVALLWVFIAKYRRGGRAQ